MNDFALHIIRSYGFMRTARESKSVILLRRRGRRSSGGIVAGILRIAGRVDAFHRSILLRAFDPRRVRQVAEETRAGRQARVDKLTGFGVIAILERALEIQTVDVLDVAARLDHMVED